MMMDRNAHRERLALCAKEFALSDPSTNNGRVAFSSSGRKNDLLGPKIRKLIALAAAEYPHDAPPHE